MIFRVHLPICAVLDLDIDRFDDSRNHILHLVPLLGDHIGTLSQRHALGPAVRFHLLFPCFHVHEKGVQCLLLVVLLVDAGLTDWC